MDDTQLIWEAYTSKGLDLGEVHINCVVPFSYEVTNAMLKQLQSVPNAAFHISYINKFIHPRSGYKCAYWIAWVGNKKEVWAQLITLFDNSDILDVPKSTFKLRPDKISSNTYKLALAHLDTQGPNGKLYPEFEQRVIELISSS